MESGHPISISAAEGGALAGLGIAAVFLFGSRAQGMAGDASDYDFAILLEDPRGFSTRSARNAAYDYLYEILEPKIARLTNIDIVFLNEANLQFQFHVVKDGRVIWETNPRRRADFIAAVMEAHADFEPLQKIFDAATLSRI